jgi:hypothetical protein
MPSCALVTTKKLISPKFKKHKKCIGSLCCVKWDMQLVDLVSVNMILFR